MTENISVSYKELKEKSKSKITENIELKFQNALCKVIYV